MERKIYLIVTAGGRGTRMGATVPKQFLTLGGKPVLRLSIEKFIEALPGVKVITVLPKSHLQTWKEYCLNSSFTYPQTLVQGGITRFHSVKNALAKVPDGAIVAVHDGVRPLLSQRMIRRMAAMMPDARALIPVVPVTDTLKALDRDTSGLLHTIPGPSPDRSRIFAAQTPQMFLSEDLKAAYSRAFSTSFTDDASVAASAGIPLGWCDGERLNIKITTPEDLRLAEAVLSLE